MLHIYMLHMYDLISLMDSLTLFQTLYFSKNLMENNLRDSSLVNLEAIKQDLRTQWYCFRMSRIEQYEALVIYTQERHHFEGIFVINL